MTTLVVPAPVTTPPPALLAESRPTGALTVTVRVRPADTASASAIVIPVTGVVTFSAANRLDGAPTTGVAAGASAMSVPPALSPDRAKTWFA